MRNQASEMRNAGGGDGERSHADVMHHTPRTHEWFSPRLVTDDELQKTANCENCTLTKPKHPYHDTKIKAARGAQSPHLRRNKTVEIVRLWNPVNSSYLAVYAALRALLLELISGQSQKLFFWLRMPSVLVCI